MNVSRRWFIGGAASFGALQGCKVFRDPAGLFGAGRPNLRFGVISDIHIIAQNVDKGHQGNTRTLEHAFRWFDAQGVDGVMIAGDMADAGLVSQLQCVADAWYKVFPNDEGADGRHVEKLFVYGNHDWEGCFYGYDIYGNKSGDLTSDHLRRFGMKKAWERIFNEEYTPIYRKTVKGYDFIGAHWDGNNGMFDWGGSKTVEKWFAEHGKSLDPKLPFFYCQHPHPKDTCYGSWAWGHDGGQSTRALSPFPNAVAFSGHSHYSLLDERSIWQGAFTSLGTGSLRYAGGPYDEFAAEGGYENTGAGGKVRPDGEKSMPGISNTPDERNGYLVSVFDDRIVYRRRDFLADCDLGPDWVMPLPAAESKPFAFATRAAQAEAPAFDAGAKVTAKAGKALTRKAAGVKYKKPEDKAKAELPAVNVEFPPATAKNRPWRYDVRAEKEDGSLVLLKRVLSPDYHLPKVETRIKLAFFAKELPADAKVRFVVTPYECYGRAGDPIASGFVKV